MATDRKTLGESNGTVVADILHDVQELLGQQLSMFRAEIQEDMRKTRQAAVVLAVGIAVGLLAVGLLGLTLAHLVHWLFPELPQWAAFGLVTGGLALLSGALMLAGKKRLESFNPLPDQTVQAAKENVQWLTQPK